MFRTYVRRYSVKNIPFEAKPKNKYNSKTSAFNLRPVPTPGLVYNPPASIPGLKNTPKAFLPPNDPRLKVLTFKTYTKDELNDMPVIYGYAKEKNCSVTPEIVKQIVELRTSDPKEWTVSKLCKKFDVSGSFVLAVTRDFKPKFNTKPVLTERQVDHKKRVQMWLRNE